MNPKDVSYNWLSSGGAYTIIAIIWVLSAIFFGSVAKSVGRQKNSGNDGCLLTISTTVFVAIGGSIGILIAPFPFFIFTSMIGAILGPWLAVRIFKNGRKKY